MWRVTTLDESVKGTQLFFRHFLAWAARHRLDTRSTQQLVTAARDTSGWLGEVCRETDRVAKLLADFAKHPNLTQIIRSYRMSANSYRSFLEIGAPVYWPEASTRKLLDDTAKYFYKGLLKTKVFQRTYLSPSGFVSKSATRASFGKKRRICPYCDFEHVVDPNGSSMDHFLPLSYFPLLAIHWLNLVVSCTTCNEGTKKQAIVGTLNGEPDHVPIFHPFFHQAADHIRFAFEFEINDTMDLTLDIDIRADTQYAIDYLRGENYISLFDLNTRYKRFADELLETYEDILSSVRDAYSDTPIQGVIGRDQLELHLGRALRKKIGRSRRNRGRLPFTKLHEDFFLFLLGRLDDEVTILAYGMNIS